MGFAYFSGDAGVAQLVERDVPNVNVEGSNPFARSGGSKRDNPALNERAAVLATALKAGKIFLSIPRVDTPWK